MHRCSILPSLFGRQRRGRYLEIERSLYRQRSDYGLYRSNRCAGGQLGESRRLLHCSQIKLADEVLKQARVDRLRVDWRRIDARHLAALRLRSSACAIMISGYGFRVPLLPGDHVTEDTGTGFVHTAPGHGREDFDIWTANARELDSARHQDRHSLHRRCRRPLHRAGARLRRQARAHGKRREGRRQRGGHQGLDRRRHADRARALEASVSAFVALEEAGDFSQHAAMVHRHGHTYRVAAEARAHTASACQRSD